MLIAVQSSAPFGRREGVAPHILCADSALQVILAVIKSATLRVEKVCTLNAKGTAGRRRPKRSRQKPSAITLRIRRHRRFARARVQQRERSVRRRSSCRVLKL